MTKLTKAKARLDTLGVKWRKAHAELREDRNQIAGKIYEQQKVVNEMIDAQARDEYAASYLERWPR